MGPGTQFSAILVKMADLQPGNWPKNEKFQNSHIAFLEISLLD